MQKHTGRWISRSSFKWQVECSCGFKTRMHLMERDAITEMDMHVKQNGEKP